MMPSSRPPPSAEPEPHRKATWMELFFHLVFVSCHCLDGALAEQRQFAPFLVGIRGVVCPAPVDLGRQHHDVDGFLGLHRTRNRHCGHPLKARRATPLSNALGPCRGTGVVRVGSSFSAPGKQSSHRSDFRRIDGSRLAGHVDQVKSIPLATLHLMMNSAFHPIGRLR